MSKPDDFEAVCTVKARYWRAIDTRDVKLLRRVLVDDVLVDFRGSLGGDPAQDAQSLWHSAEAFTAAVLAMGTGVTTIHRGFVPEIEWKDDDQISAIWPMEDMIIVNDTSSAFPFRRFHGWGHYLDLFRRTDEGWRVAETRLHRSRVETI